MNKKNPQSFSFDPSSRNPWLKQNSIYFMTLSGFGRVFFELMFEGEDSERRFNFPSARMK